MIRPGDSLPSLAPAPSRDFPALRRVLPFTLPYRTRMAGAMLALLVASATVLGLGQGLRRLVDDGFKSADAATLDRAVLVLIGVIVLLASSTFCRFYLVSWISERVVADIRRAVFDRVGGLAMLAVTSIKLTLLVLLIVAVVIVPILFYGRSMAGGCGVCRATARTQSPPSGLM